MNIIFMRGMEDVGLLAPKVGRGHVFTISILI